MINFTTVSQDLSVFMPPAPTDDKTSGGRSWHVEHAGRDCIDFSGLPGAIQTFRTVEYIRSCHTRIAASGAIGDIEGEGDAAYKMSQIPIIFGGSVCATVAFLKNFSFAARFLWVRVAFVASIVFGFISTVLESIYDAYWIYREKKLLERPEMEILRLVKNNPSYEKLQEVLTKHQMYFERMLEKYDMDYANAIMGCTQQNLSGTSYCDLRSDAETAISDLALKCLEKKYFVEGDDRQRVKLERRIRPWCYDRINKELKGAIALLDSPFKPERKKGLEKANEIFDLIEAQAKKKALNHILGIIYTALIFGGLIATCIPCPALIPLVLLIASVATATFQHCLYTGILDNPGWEFTPITCIPECIRNLAKKIRNCISESAPAIEQQPARYKNFQFA